MLRVAPLELLRPGGDPESSPAVTLFLERARAIRPELEIHAEAASIVAEICGRLEGLPLAIVLAAARLRHLSLAALRDHHHRLRVVTGGPRDVPPRQRAMRDTVAWSYDLLQPEAQQLFARLSIFAEGWTLEATDAVCQLPTTDVLEEISAINTRRPEG